MRKGTLVLVPVLALLALSGVPVVHGVVTPGAFKATVSPTGVSTDGSVTITFCPSPSDCAYPVDIQGCVPSGSVQDGTRGAGGTDCGGVSVIGPDETEWIYTKSIHIESPNSFTITFGTGSADPFAVEAEGSGCTGFTPVVDTTTASGANTHCSGAYSVVVEGTAGKDQAGAPVPILESPTDTSTDAGEFKVASACFDGSVFDCSFTVPEFGAPVVAVSALGLLLFAFYRKQHPLQKS